jgi:2'-5' RNA ligase
MPPHITLVPPVNVAAAALGDALAVIRGAAARVPRLRLALGPVRTFAPDTPVIYLGVGGDLEYLRALRDAVFVAPLVRPLSWPWVPHVTLADEASEDQLAAAVSLLGRYATLTEIDRVVLLEESGHHWTPLADAQLGGRWVTGTGGLAVELTAGRLLDPEGRELTGRLLHPSDGSYWSDGGDDPVVVTARREGAVVGVARAWRADTGGHVTVLVDPPARGQGIGTQLLATVEAVVTGRGWKYPHLAAHGPAGFYRRRSAYSKATDE